MLPFHSLSTKYNLSSESDKVLLNLREIFRSGSWECARYRLIRRMKSREENIAGILVRNETASSDSSRQSPANFFSLRATQSMIFFFSFFFFLLDAFEAHLYVYLPQTHLSKNLKLILCLLPGGESINFLFSPFPTRLRVSFNRF